MSVVDEVRSALIWQPRQLASVKEGPVRQFVDVMNLMFDPELMGAVKHDHPLSRAAHGLAYEFDDRPDEAAAEYQALVDDDELLVRVLGLALLGWAGDGDSASLDAALDLAEQGHSDDTDLMKALCCKLLCLSLDIGEVEPAGRFLDRAQELFDDRSATWAALSHVGHNSLGRDLVMYSDQLEERLDAEPTIENLVAGVARRSMEQGFEESFRSPWRPIFKFGDQNLNAISAAELQALWAGAAWLVPGVRKLLAAQLFSGSGETKESYEYGLAYWALGGGKQLRGIADNAEARFDAGSAERVLVRHMRGGRRFGRRAAFLRTCQALWHQLPALVVHQVLEDSSPSDSSEAGDAIRLLWCSLAVTHTAESMQPYAELSDAEVEALVPAMPLWVAARLDQARADRLYAAALAAQHNAVDAPERSNDRLLISLHRTNPDRRPLPPGFMDVVDDLDLAWMGEDGQRLVGQDQLAKRLARQIEMVDGLREAGRAGTESMFATDPFVSLGAVASMLKAPSDVARDALSATATDPRMPSRYRAGALYGLRLYVDTHGWDPALDDVLRDLPFGRADLGAGVPHELLRVRYLRIISSVRPLDEPWELVELARSNDAFVRAEAIELAAGLEDQALVSTCLGGALYDPAAEVMRAALALCVTPAVVGLPVLRLAKRRSIDLAITGTAWDRVAAIRAIRRLVEVDPSWEPGPDALGAARSDRSWLVRDAVADEATD